MTFVGVTSVPAVQISCAVIEIPKNRPADDSLLGPSRRTVLASERTWLAWWRTGIAVSATAIAVGGLIPRIVDTSRTPFTLLGVGYALLAVLVFIGAYSRHRATIRALETGSELDGEFGWILGLTVFGALLAVATVIVLAIEA